MIDIRKLEVFLNLTKTLNYSKTAEQLFTTQGNVSKQVQALEKELNTKLVDRSHRTITLTNSGIIVGEYVAKIMTDFNEMRQTLTRQIYDEDNLLTINAVPSVSNYQGLELITEFHDKHPEVRLNLSEIEGNLIMNTLDGGNSNIVFNRDFSEYQNEYDTVEVEEDSFVCILPANHLLAEKDVVPLAELADEDFLLLGRETLLYDRVIELTKKAGFEPHVIYAGKQFKSISSMIAKGLGISIVMEKSVDIPNDGSIIMRPLDISEKSQMLFIKNKNTKHARATEMFWNFIQGK